jgi:hypothetical protein
MSGSITDLLEFAREKYPNMKVYVDDYLYWYTAVIFLNDTHFVLFHNYFDNPVYEEMCLFDGTVDKDNSVLYINAFVGQSHEGCLAWTYLLNNKIPTQFLADTLNKKQFEITSIPNPPIIAIGDWDKVVDSIHTLVDSML